MFDKTHAVVDIETLGVKPGCPITSIGLIVFNIRDLINKRGVQYFGSFPISIESNIRMGLVSDEETVAFWNEQDEELRTKILGGEEDLFTQLNKFNNTLKLNNIDCIWGNSPSFDLSILEHAMELCSIDKSWDYSMERDVRTVRKMGLIDPNKVSKYYDMIVKHDPLHDCFVEMMIIAQSLCYINPGAHTLNEDVLFTYIQEAK